MSQVKVELAYEEVLGLAHRNTELEEDLGNKNTLSSLIGAFQKDTADQHKDVLKVAHEAVRAMEKNEEVCRGLTNRGHLCPAGW